MRCPPTFGLVLLSAILPVLYPLPSNAQLTPRLQNCSGRFDHNVLSQVHEEAVHPKVSIEDVTFQGEMDLPESIKEELVEAVEQTSFDTDSDWIRPLQETILEPLQQNGYSFAQVTAEPHAISTQPQITRVSVTFHINEGAQYRLREIRFNNANVFPAEQLRSQFALQDGDIFDLRKIRQGIEALTGLYGRHGYLNFTASPDLHVDNAQRRVSVLMELGEEKQFRVGKIEILGLDPKIVNSVLKTKLRQGDIFNSKLIEDFYKDNKSVLPADASSNDDTVIKQDPQKGTVAIVFDFQACPQASR